MGMPAGRGKECLMVDKPKLRRIGISDRVRIQAALESGLPPSKIAEDTGFSKSAICREITSRSTVKNPTAPRCRPGLYVCNKCVKRAYCRKRKLYYSYRSADADAAAKRRGPRSGRRLTEGQIKSLDGLTQADLDEAFSNINSFVRLSKGDKTPFELAEAKFGRGFCEALRIRKVDKKKVRLLAAI